MAIAATSWGEEPGRILAPGMRVDDDLADVVLAGGDRVDAQQQLAGPPVAERSSGTADGA